MDRNESEAWLGGMTLQKKIFPNEGMVISKSKGEDWKGVERNKTRIGRFGH